MRVIYRLLCTGRPKIRKHTQARGRNRPARRPQGGAAEVRIIGGEWRGRKLPVLDAAGLRPTANRLRETLFNWLQFDLVGLHCLDLFAGTGALGLEALSRGAGQCAFVEVKAPVMRQLHGYVERLGADSRAQLYQQSALDFLRQSTDTFDLIFVDPPFDGDYWADVLAQLPARLNPGARVYLERPIGYSAGWPEGWECQRESKAGDAVGALLTYSPPQTDDFATGRNP